MRIPLLLLCLVGLPGLDAGKVVLTGTDPAAWAAQLRPLLAAELKRDEDDVLVRLLAATLVQKAGVGADGVARIEAKMAGRPFEILGQFRPVVEAVDASPLPAAWKRAWLAHLGGRYLFPIRQGPPVLATASHCALLAGLPAASTVHALPAEQTLVQLLSERWPAMAALSPLRQWLVYEALAQINPALQPIGQHLADAGTPGAKRADLGPDLESVQMQCWLRDIDPTLVPAADDGVGEVFCHPLGGGRFRHVRYRLPAGAELLIPPAGWLAAASDPRALSCVNTGLIDLGLLAGCTATSLDLAGCDVVDLSPLASWSQLTSLRLDRCPVRDLTPLAGLRLERLGLRGCPVSDLAGIAALPLEQLDLHDSAVGDLAPITGMPLRRLDCAGSPVTDLAPLQGKDLEWLQLDRFVVYRNHAALAGIDRIGDVPRADWLADQVALAAGRGEDVPDIDCGDGGRAAKTDAKVPEPRTVAPTGTGKRTKKGLDAALDDILE